MLRAVVITALVGSALLWADGRALAQTRIETGRERLQQADFEGAARAFDAAEQLDTLSRDELVELYAGRAAAHLALGHEERMDEDIRRLASLEPGYRFGEEARPELREALERASSERPSAITIEASASQQAGGVTVTATVAGDDMRLVRTVRLAARNAGSEWMTTEERSLLVPVVDGAVVEYYAVAVGPGGAELATSGTESNPRTLQATGGAPLDDGSHEVSGDDDGPNLVPLWVTLGVVGAAVIVTVIAVLATGKSTNATQPDPPVIWPAR